MLKSLLVALGLVGILLALPSLAAQDKKIWACAADGTDEEDLYLVDWGAYSYVKLYGVRIWGNFEISGDERRWDFGEGNRRIAEYSVILKPGGELDYYDFREVKNGEAVEPAYKYHCRLAQS